jgi:N-methylhydantoinase B
MLVCDEKLKEDIMVPSPDFPLALVAGEDDRGNVFGTAILEPLAAGLGAASYKDGVDTGGLQFNPLGVIANAEVIEQGHPFVYLYRRELADSGGAGRWRGGVGQALGIMPYRTKGKIQIGTFSAGAGASLYSANGLFGGYPSPTARYCIRKGTNIRQFFKDRRIPGDASELNSEESHLLGGKSNGETLGEGDVFDYFFAGGGGYGDPLEREPERVASDFERDYVSRQAASDQYGVVLDDDGQVDAAATQRLRDEMHEERKAWRAPRGPDPQEPAQKVAANGKPPRAVHESLVERDDADRRVLACSRCEEVLCDYTDDYKRYCRWDENPVTTISPITEDPAYFVDDPVVFRRYCCPGCQILLTTEVLRADQPGTPEMRLSA